MLDKGKPVFEFTDQRAITIPPELDSIALEAVGDYLKNAAQDGYMLRSVVPLTAERGTQRDPVTVTLGVKLVMSR